MFEKAELESAKDQPNQLIIAISSDRGLCGAIHSGISKAIRAKTAAQPEVSTKLVICGDKARTILQRTHSMLLLFFCVFFLMTFKWYLLDIMFLLDIEL